MALNLQEKKTIVKKITKIAENSLSVVIANFSGIQVNKINELRKFARGNDVYIYVIKNTLIKKIINSTSFKCLKDICVGPTLIAFSKKHPRSAALLLKNFAKNNINFEIKGASFQNKFIATSNIDYLATLPTYKEAVVNLMLCMKEASSGKLIRTLTILSNQKKEAL